LRISPFLKTKSLGRIRVILVVLAGVKSMTGWHLIAGYSLIGVVYFVVTIAGQLIGSLSRPPIEGHLDVNIRFGRLGRWFVISAMLVAPFAIAYAGEWSNDYRAKLERTNNVLSMYMGIALFWIIKLQLQISKIINRND